MVWYELYNEPHNIEYDDWANADGTKGYWGMKAMYDTVRKYTTNPVVIAGTDWAYDVAQCIKF